MLVYNIKTQGGFHLGHPFFIQMNQPKFKAVNYLGGGQFNYNYEYVLRLLFLQ